jgi:hypothetical protein
MGQFRRKGEGSSGASQSGDTGGQPDFSALSGEGGTSQRDAFSRADAAPEANAPVEAANAAVNEAAAPAELRRPSQAPGRKRYYNPGEVMRKKGCIGCGGMVLAVPFIVTLAAVAIKLF